MPNSLTAAGLTTATQPELLAQYILSFQTIYGPDIVLTSDTPDGQRINLFIQSVLDVENLQSQIYATFDPDQAFGNTLDLRVAINGIQRQAGTFTVTNITVVTTQSVNLYGLDQTDQPVFTVQDNAGDQFQLQQTQLGLLAGTHALAFQAVTPGATVTVPNTITTPVTIVLGVASINNPTTYTTLGINEESDALLKIRRQKSVSLGSQGYLAGLIAALENVNGVTFVNVEENSTGTTNADGVPGHSIWVIVAGSGAAADIAQAIYVKRNAGCGMYNSGDAGAESFPVVQVDGSSFTVFWDTVITSQLFVSFTATSLDKVNPPNIAAIRSGLVTAFTPGVAEQVNINDLATIVQDIDPNTLVTNAGFNDETVQTITFSGIAASGTFKFSYNGNLTATINWNDTIATIQTRLRALTGLGAVTATGSIASQSIVVTMVGVTTPSAIGVSVNTLVTSVPAAITLNFLTTFTSAATPSAKNKQFILSSADIIIHSIIVAAPAGVIGIGYNINSTTGVVTNATLTITHGTLFTFLGLGGYGTLVYSVSSGTGGSINSSTGVYTAGSAGTDTITATDNFGRTGTCVVTVV